MESIVNKFVIIHLNMMGKERDRREKTNGPIVMTTAAVMSCNNFLKVVLSIN